MNEITSSEANSVKDDFDFMIFFLKFNRYCLPFNVISSYTKHNYSIFISEFREKRLLTETPLRSLSCGKLSLCINLR